MAKRNMRIEQVGKRRTNDEQSTVSCTLAWRVFSLLALFAMQSADTSRDYSYTKKSVEHTMNRLRNYECLLWKQMRCEKRISGGKRLRARHEPVERRKSLATEKQPCHMSIQIDRSVLPTSDVASMSKVAGILGLRFIAGDCDPIEKIIRPRNPLSLERCSHPAIGHRSPTATKNDKAKF